MQIIGVFQSAKFKSFNKVYKDRLVKLGNQELSAVFLLICTLLLMYDSVIFNRIIDKFEKFKFPVFLNVAKMSFMLSPISILNLLTPISIFNIQTLYDKHIKKLVLKLLLICCGDVESNPGPKNQHQISFCHWNLNKWFSSP